MCYINFCRVAPTARSGTVHITGLNPFSLACFSGNLYWDDVRMCVQVICAAGGFSKSIAIAPISGQSGLKVMPEQSGTLAFGADGAYANRVYLWSACYVAYTVAVDQITDFAPTLLHDLAAIRVTHTRHQSVEARSLFILKETAVASKENRALDPFLLVGLLQKTYAMTADSVRSVINKHSRACSFAGAGQGRSARVQSGC